MISQPYFVLLGYVYVLLFEQQVAEIKRTCTARIAFLLHWRTTSMCSITVSQEGGG